MKDAVIVFPGSNCDRDCKVAIERSAGARVEMAWHRETALPDDLDLVILPGGFQLLCEAGLPPGALLRNEKLKYICKPVDLDIVNSQTRFIAEFGEQREAVMTVGNGEDNFFTDEVTLNRIEGEGQVVFRSVFASA